MTTSPRSNWNYPTAVRFGAGRIAELAEACKAVGMQAPLIVTDPFLATQAMTKAALDQLTGAGLKAAIFSDIKPNPVETNVYKGLEADLQAAQAENTSKKQPTSAEAPTQAHSSRLA